MKIEQEVEIKKRNMQLSYSKIKENLNFNIDRSKDNSLAYITHYFQNYQLNNDCTFKKPAIQYIIKKSNIAEEPVIEQYLPITFDVPFPPPKKAKFTFIDLFAGIGGFRLAMQNIGGKCVFSSEIDKAAKKTYDLNYGEIPFGDIKEFTDERISDKELDNLIPNHDILAGGFPCQPFSRAGVSARNFLGKVHGFEDENQGNLFYDIMRIVQVKKPKVLFLENVKNLKSHDKGQTFQEIERIIKEMGYVFYWAIINSETVVPQRRERTYMVAFKSNVGYRFPNFDGEKLPLNTILENNVDEKYTISDRLWEGHKNRSIRNKARGTGFTVKLADLNKPSNTIVARYYKDGKECLVPQKGKNPRMLTPRECARLQGYPENFKLPNSKAAAYRQFGNSVAVPVIEKIAQSIIKTMEENELL